VQESPATAVAETHASPEVKPLDTVLTQALVTKKHSNPRFALQPTIVEDAKELEAESSPDPVPETRDSHVDASVTEAQQTPAVHMNDAAALTSESTTDGAHHHEQHDDPQVASPLTSQKTKKSGIFSLFKRSKSGKNVPVAAAAVPLQPAAVYHTPDIGMRAADMKTTAEQRIAVMSLVKDGSLSINEALDAVLEAEHRMAQVFICSLPSDHA
jgi:hypothetical protein